MKKLGFIFIFFVFCGIFIFSDNDEKEEIDFLLFSPNSGNQFVDAARAYTQLDNLAKYLLNKTLVPGQINVYGYAAFAPNDIEPVGLSRERALFVINELQKRGVSKDLFSDPRGYGSVSLWGNNADEDDRRPNRRVRILLSGETPISVTPEVINAEAESAVPAAVPVAVPEEPAARPAARANAPEESSFMFPWWLLLLFAVLLLLFPLLMKMSRKPVHKDVTANARPQAQKTDTAPVYQPAPEPARKAESAPTPAASVITINLDEEIRFSAYEYYQRRDGIGELREQDWFNGLRDVSALYKSKGYSVYFEAGYWWANILTTKARE